MTQSDIRFIVLALALSFGAFKLVSALMALPPTPEQLAVQQRAQQQQVEQQQAAAARQKRAQQEQWEREQFARQYYHSREEMDDTIRTQNYFDARRRWTETSARPDRC